MKVSSLSCLVFQRKENDAEAMRLRYEGYDIITLQKLIEREYTIPEPQTAEEVIGYYARRIAQDVKLPSQFAALAPKVREFLETKAWVAGSIDDRAMVKPISSNVAQYVTVKTFAEALRKLVIDELRHELLHAGRLLSETPPFPWSRLTAAADKCVFNLVPCGNNFEKDFALFLQKASDVERFAKLRERFCFAIEYMDNMGNLRYYEPDFVAETKDGTHYLAETKGLEDVNVANKDRAARIWCENATKLLECRGLSSRLETATSSSNRRGRGLVGPRPEETALNSRMVEYMSLNIKNEEAHALATRLAKATGESLTEAVTVALRERLARIEAPEALERELLELGQDCAWRLKEPWRSADHADLLYDEIGLPK